jgi:hypothetical protein
VIRRSSLREEFHLQLGREVECLLEASLLAGTSFLIAGRNLLLSFSHQGRVLHPPNCGFVVGRELQWLLVSVCGAAFSDWLGRIPHP